MSVLFRSSQMNRQGIGIAPLLSALVLAVGVMSAPPASAVEQAAPRPAALATAVISEAQFSRLIAQVEQTSLVLAKAEPTKTQKRSPRRGWLRKISRRFDRKILQRAKLGLSKITRPVRRIGRKGGEAVGWVISQPVSVVDRRAGKKVREDLQRVLGGTGAMLAEYKFGGTTFGKRVSRWDNQLKRATAAAQQIRDLPTRKQFRQRFEDWAGRQVKQAVDRGLQRTRDTLNKLKQKVQHKANRFVDRARKKIKSAEQRLRSTRERLREIEEKAKWVTNPEEKARLELERKALKHRDRLQAKVKKRLEPLRKKVEERVQRLEEGFQERVQRLEKKRDEKLHKIDEKLERLKTKRQKVDKKLERLRRIFEKARTPPIVPGGSTDKEEAKDKSPFVDDPLSKKRDSLLASGDAQRDQRLKKQLEDEAYGIQKGVSERKKLIKELDRIGVKVEQGMNTKKLRQALKDAEKKAKQKKEEKQRLAAEAKKKKGEEEEKQRLAEEVKKKKEKGEEEEKQRLAAEAKKKKEKEEAEEKQRLAAEAKKKKEKEEAEEKQRLAEEKRKAEQKRNEERKKLEEQKKKMAFPRTFEGSGSLIYTFQACFGNQASTSRPVKTNVKMTLYGNGNVTGKMSGQINCWFDDNGDVLDCKEISSVDTFAGSHVNGELKFGSTTGSYGTNDATLRFNLSETQVVEGKIVFWTVSGSIKLQRE